MKNRLNNRMYKIKTQIYKQKDKAKKNRQRSKMKKKCDDTLRNFLDNIKQMTFTLQGFQKKKREKWPEKLFEYIMAKNFPNLGKETDIQVQKAQRVLSKINPKRNRKCHIIIKMKGI